MKNLFNKTFEILHIIFSERVDEEILNLYFEIVDLLYDLTSSDISLVKPLVEDIVGIFCN